MLGRGCPQAAYNAGTLSESQFSELQALQAEQADFIIDSATHISRSFCPALFRLAPYECLAQENVSSRTY